jgi:hypothetical protein
LSRSTVGCSISLGALGNTATRIPCARCSQGPLSLNRAS